MKTKDRNENLRRSYKLDIKIKLSQGQITLAVVVISLLSQYGEQQFIFFDLRCSYTVTQLHKCTGYKVIQVKQVTQLHMIHKLHSFTVTLQFHSYSGYSGYTVTQVRQLHMIHKLHRLQSYTCYKVTQTYVTQLHIRLRSNTLGFTSGSLHSTQLHVIRVTQFHCYTG